VCFVYADKVKSRTVRNFTYYGTCAYTNLIAFILGSFDLNDQFVFGDNLYGQRRVMNINEAGAMRLS